MIHVGTVQCNRVTVELFFRERSGKRGELLALSNKVKVEAFYIFVSSLEEPFPAEIRYGIQLSVFQSVQYVSPISYPKCNMVRIVTQPA